jgi:hypothetical protein
VLSPEDLERYRRMTPAERLRETFQLCAVADRALDALPEAERSRRLAIIEEEHRASNAELLRRLSQGP